MSTSTTNLVAAVRSVWGRRETLTTEEALTELRAAAKAAQREHAQELGTWAACATLMGRMAHWMSSTPATVIGVDSPSRRTQAQRLIAWYVREAQAAQQLGLLPLTNPDPATPPLESLLQELGYTKATLCTATGTGLRGSTYRCSLPAYHSGMHQASDGTQWQEQEQEAAEAATLNPNDLHQLLARLANYLEHDDTAPRPRWLAEQRTRLLGDVDHWLALTQGGRGLAQNATEPQAPLAHPSADSYGSQVPGCWSCGHGWEFHGPEVPGCAAECRCVVPGPDWLDAGFARAREAAVVPTVRDHMAAVAEGARRLERMGVSMSEAGRAARAAYGRRGEREPEWLPNHPAVVDDGRRRARRVVLEVTMRDHQVLRREVTGVGWKVNVSRRVLVIGHGVPREEVPLDGVLTYRLLPVGEESRG